MGRPDIASLLRALVDLLCGARCVGCGARGVATPCGQCRHALVQMPRHCDAAFPDSGVARQLVRAAKFGHWRGGGRVLARSAAARLPHGRVDLVTWVPAERSRRATRGGHLPEQLARTWARQLGVPCRALLRRRAGPPQRGLDRAQRRRNVADVWSLAPGVRPATLRGCRILLVDDIRTSGATLEAAGALLEAFGSAVERFAIVQHGTPNDLGWSGVRTCAGMTAGIHARCEEFPLTTVRFAADSVEHDRRKDAPRVRRPRPP